MKENETFARMCLIVRSPASTTSSSSAEVAAQFGDRLADHRDVLADEVADGVDEGRRPNPPAAMIAQRRLAALPCVSALEQRAVRRRRADRRAAPPSASSPICAANSVLLISFTSWPAPSGPDVQDRVAVGWPAAGVPAPRRRRRRRRTASPRPAAMSCGPPLTGASITSMHARGRRWPRRCAGCPWCG